MNASPLFEPSYPAPESSETPQPPIHEMPRFEPTLRRGAGRPSECTPNRVYAVCTMIRMTGVSDTAAAALAGVTRSTLSRWKLNDEEVEMQLAAARAQYLLPRLEKIGQTLRADGQFDWRAQAWLVKYASPETEGRPSSRRRLRDVEVTEDDLRAAEANLQVAVAPGSGMETGAEQPTHGANGEKRRNSSRNSFCNWRSRLFDRRTGRLRVGSSGACFSRTSSAPADTPSIRNGVSVQSAFPNWSLGTRGGGRGRRVEEEKNGGPTPCVSSRPRTPTSGLTNDR